jgi:DNA-binding PadR family transcriptional regulator
MRVSEAQRRVLQKGECTLYLIHPGGVRYDVWSALVARGLIQHKESRLDAPWPYERYTLTPAGRKALEESSHVE